MEAIKGGHVDVVRALVRARARADLVDHDGEVPLRHIVRIDRPRRMEMWQSLLEGAEAYGVDLANWWGPVEFNDEGWSLLHEAAFGAHRDGFSNADIAHELVRVGLDPNHESREGLTPLIQAVRGGNLELVQFFVEEAHVEIGASNRYGQNAPREAGRVGAQDVPS